MQIPEASDRHLNNNCTAPQSSGPRSLSHRPNPPVLISIMWAYAEVVEKGQDFGNELLDQGWKGWHLQVRTIFLPRMDPPHLNDLLESHLTCLDIRPPTCSAAIVHLSLGRYSSLQLFDPSSTPTTEEQVQIKAEAYVYHTVAVRTSILHTSRVLNLYMAIGISVRFSEVHNFDQFCTSIQDQPRPLSPSFAPASHCWCPPEPLTSNSTGPCRARRGRSGPALANRWRCRMYLGLSPAWRRHRQGNY